MDKRIKWHVEKRLISDLKPYEKNPRIITEQGLKHLKNSFDEIGFCQPININTDNTILSGHARIQQLKLDGVTEVDVYVPDRKLTPKQEEAVIIRMNKNTAGQWDFDKLANEFDIDNLIDWGFTADEIFKFDAVDEEEKEKEQGPVNYALEVKFKNDMEMMDIHDDLVSKGYVVKVKS